MPGSGRSARNLAAWRCEGNGWVALKSEDVSCQRRGYIPHLLCIASRRHDEADESFRRGSAEPVAGKDLFGKVCCEALTTGEGLGRTHISRRQTAPPPSTGNALLSHSGFLRGHPGGELLSLRACRKARLENSSSDAL